MTVKSSFVQAHQLLRTLTTGRRSNLGGAGGASESITARVQNIQLGRFVIDKPLIELSQAVKETEVRSNFAGVVGGEVFRRFTLILDYSRRRIFLEPNAHLLEPVEADMSGIELAADGEDFKTFVVNEVAADSPAAEAGLKEEDELTAVDGRPVSEFGLDQIRQMFEREGKEYSLSIKRGERTLQVKIKLRRLI